MYFNAPPLRMVYDLFSCGRQSACCVLATRCIYWLYFMTICVSYINRMFVCLCEECWQYVCTMAVTFSARSASANLSILL